MPSSFRALLGVALLALSGCGTIYHAIGTYRIDIQQGNNVSNEMVRQLKLGMSKEQVRFVLGTPLVTDIFHSDRWDYVYYHKPQNSNQVEKRKLTVFFKDGKLAQIERDAVALAEDAKAPAEDKK
ncbi:MAG: outer membrane protein assembly factor BamE [Burkholderiales bacterium]